MRGAKHNKCIVSLHDAVHSLFGPKRERLLLPTSALRNTVLRVNIHAASITTQPSYACTRDKESQEQTPRSKQILRFNLISKERKRE